MNMRPLVELGWDYRGSSGKKQSRLKCLNCQSKTTFLKYWYHVQAMEATGTMASFTLIRWNDKNLMDIRQ